MDFSLNWIVILGIISRKPRIKFDQIMEEAGNHIAGWYIRKILSELAEKELIEIEKVKNQPLQPTGVVTRKGAVPEIFFKVSEKGRQKLAESKQIIENWC